MYCLPKSVATALQRLHHEHQNVLDLETHRLSAALSSPATCARQMRDGECNRSYVVCRTAPCLEPRPSSSPKTNPSNPDFLGAEESRSNPRARSPPCRHSLTQRRRHPHHCSVVFLLVYSLLLTMNSSRSTLDPSISLCLACSASLPPRKALASPASPKCASKHPDEIFLTECCQRPICPACVRANPRLVRYNPCLRCLGGVGAVSAAARSPPPVGGPTSAAEKSAGGRENVDGGVKDEDVFVLGDDEDEDEGAEDAWREDGEDARASTASDSPPPATPPPAYSDITSPRASYAPSTSPYTPPPEADSGKTHESKSEATSSSGPQRYYIQPTDTLVGIALRFHVDGRTLCRLNNLPFSTLRTTPHLLHTRTFLALPASAASGSTLPSPKLNKPSPEEEARRARERAESRFRVLTKEADYRVARAYVAVAGVEDDAADAIREDEAKKSGLPTDASLKLSSAESSNLEGRAVDRYLDDEEWERRQRSDGRGVQISAFPFGASKSTNESGKKAWWRW